MPTVLAAAPTALGILGTGVMNSFFIPNRFPSGIKLVLR